MSKVISIKALHRELIFSFERGSAEIQNRKSKIKVDRVKLTGPSLTRKIGSKNRKHAPVKENR